IITTVLTVAGLAVLVWLWLRARAAHAVSAEMVGWLFLATSLVVTVTNKTLSPQYILWLGGPLAALILRAPGPAVMRAGRLLLIVCLLTQVEFPLTYDGITKDNVWSAPIGYVDLAVRNGLLVYLTYYACRQVWEQTGAAAGRATAVGEPVHDEAPPAAAPAVVTIGAGEAAGPLDAPVGRRIFRACRASRNAAPAT
ncbi:MAG: hypothetical protein JO147_09765, partial [Actinobacteria bacterium]|nr:hypothetical protein [Actinomycetota bacterium]